MAARIRTIKPEFFDSPHTAKASAVARLTYIGAWCWADDTGRGTFNPKELEGFIFPNDDIAELSRGEFADFGGVWRQVAAAYGLIVYEVDGRAYFQIPSWGKHQRVREGRASRFPSPEDPNAQILNEYCRPTSTGRPLAATGGQVPPGTGEQRNRGTGEQAPSSSLRSDEESHPPSDDSTTTDAEADRDDINRVCAHMADSVHQRTGRRPNITRAWRTAARLMLDRDQRTEADIIAAINWSANDDFWRANILSLPTLRKQYDRLSLQAARGRPRPSPLEITQPTTNAENAALVADIFTPSTLKSILAEEAS